MIEVTNLDVYGFEAAIRGMRNPYNSWHKSDSKFYEEKGYYIIGENDLDLMRKLSARGPVHSKFLRFIIVTMDINAPLYWWKEFDTYKVGTVSNSCSTMHTITKRHLRMDDFSTDNLSLESSWALYDTIKIINSQIDLYNNTDDQDLKKTYWWQIIQLLPTSFNQKRTVLLNYEVIKNMYLYRKYHKQDEWVKLCKIFEQLPNFMNIINKSL